MLGNFLLPWSSNQPMIGQSNVMDNIPSRMATPSNDTQISSLSALLIWETKSSARQSEKTRAKLSRGKMAEFKDSSLWVRIAFLLTLFGMFMFCFSLGYTGFGGTAHKDSVKATMVIAILGYITATFLIMLMVFLDELKDNKIAAIIFIIAAFVTGMNRKNSFCHWFNWNCWHKFAVCSIWRAHNFPNALYQPCTRDIFPFFLCNCYNNYIRF